MISAQTARRAVWRPLRELPSHFGLIISLARRETSARYKGSVLGIVWAVLTPIVTIATLTLIFAGIFGARFSQSSSGWEFALYLFCGLLPWGAFQEAVQVSSQKIVSQANLVKRVVFPLEILPVAQTLASLANQLFGTIALLILALIIQRTIHPTILWLPVLIGPQLLATFGAAWLVASLGVFLRDIVQGIALLLMVWMYLTPIIYPEAIVPERFRPFINVNPFTHLIRSYRNIMLEGVAPDWRGLAYFTGFALITFIFGYWWFARTRKNFADVI
ncbi:MAG: lipopolysaccharide transport system permease protein [Acidobacteriota bacterium]|jgi:lipopolysaccharide transport system permease protein|nr:lipopolysaccharide transport system permease protein [Acidobacteriota bacterium]